MKEVVFFVFFYGVGDWGVLNFFVFVNGILRYCMRVLFVFKIIVFLCIGLEVVFMIVGGGVYLLKLEVIERIFIVLNKMKME